MEPEVSSSCSKEPATGGGRSPYFGFQNYPRSSATSLYKQQLTRTEPQQPFTSLHFTSLHFTSSHSTLSTKGPAYNNHVWMTHKTPSFCCCIHRCVSGHQGWPHRKRRFKTSLLARVRNLLPSNWCCLQSHYLATGLRAKIYFPCMLHAMLISSFLFWSVVETDEVHELWSSSLCNFLQPHLSSSFLDPNILLSTPFSNTLSLCSSPTFPRHSSNPNMHTKLRFGVF
jgi:hypothetical protein